MNYYQNFELISMLREALGGEENAVRKYYALAEMSPNNDLMRFILNIRKDEMRHAIELRSFLTCLTGMMYSGEIDYRDGEVTDFRTGVRAAIKGEEEDAAFYKRIMEAATYYPELYYTIAKIRKDEQTHALLFRSMLD